MIKDESKELLEKTPEKTRWEIATKTYTGSVAGYDIFVGQAMGKEKWIELHDNLWGEGGKMTYPQIKEAFNIEVKDAPSAGTLVGLVALLGQGPEYEWEITESTPERQVLRITKCPWFNRYTEFGLKPEDMICAGGHIAFVGEGIKAVNPKIKHTLTKAMPWGDSYCEGVFELEE
ncbi:hypothetical protein [Candidatus Borrarchaeum sp.]|uniref:hypothetical protein n=1 Tax=Candidatus Borrarchaeum sp. TaxID=2846742 RepID=UPI00257E2F02|nr:hypothetical protein [Candidatus Borrarchaeum sp.]